MSDQDPVAACLQGQITAEVAVARMLLAGDNADAISRRVQAHKVPGKAWSALNRLVARRIVALGRLRRMIDEAAIDHDGAATPSQIGALFDRAVATSPEASVALYSGIPSHSRRQLTKSSAGCDGSGCSPQVWTCLILAAASDE
jgi:hypothetical protein